VAAVGQGNGRDYVQWPRGIAMLKEAGRITGKHVDVLDTVAANADWRTRTYHTTLDNLERQLRWRGRKVREQLRQVLHDLAAVGLVENDVRERSAWWAITVPWLRTGSYDPTPYLAARAAPSSAPPTAPPSDPPTAPPTAPSDGDGVWAEGLVGMRDLRAAPPAQEVEVEEEVTNYGRGLPSGSPRAPSSSLFIEGDGSPTAAVAADADAAAAEGFYCTCAASTAQWSFDEPRLCHTCGLRPRVPR
jgi:hypothetical protein